MGANERRQWKRFDQKAAAKEGAHGQGECEEQGGRHLVRGVERVLEANKNAGNEGKHGKETGGTRQSLVCFKPGEMGDSRDVESDAQRDECGD